MGQNKGKHCDVVVIGAGPYGLSLAAHLDALGVSFRIFGKPLDSWRNHMPKGMMLKSPGMATSLSSPRTGSRLEDYCAATATPWDEHRIPVSLDLFNTYSGLFQKNYVPMLEDKLITHVARDGEGFVVETDDGERLKARRVVSAAGITNLAYIPEGLRHLPPEVLSHSYAHRDVSNFKGRSVAVLGGGSSAIDLAAELADEGADVTVIARRDTILFHTPPQEQDEKLINQLKYPLSGIGPGWRSFLCANAPLLFKRMPEDFRLRAVRRHLGPSPGWFMREKVDGKIPMLLGRDLRDAVMAQGGKVRVSLSGEMGQTTHEFEHVIAATGYRPDLTRLSFLAPELRNGIAHVANTPILSDSFESSVPGLYFCGSMAANAFGPLMRFMVGAEFAAPRIARHLSKRVGRSLRQAA